MGIPAIFSKTPVEIPVSVSRMVSESAETEVTSVISRSSTELGSKFSSASDKLIKTFCPV